MSSCIYKLLSDFIITSQKKQKQIYHFTSHTTNSNKKISPQNTYSYHHWAINSNPLWWPFAAPHLWCHCCDPILRKIALAKPRGKTKGKTWHGGPNLSWGTGFLGQRGSEIESNFEVEKTKVKQNTVRFEEPETSNDSRHTTGISWVVHRMFQKLRANFCSWVCHAAQKTDQHMGV